jgi:DNA polymerase III epsilon subunit-like protein
MDYVLYVVDTETTGLDPYKNDVVELSILRMSDGAQKTWFIKPINQENIEQAALRINGYKLEDLRHETKYGRETYLDPVKVIVEAENWISEDGVPAENRVVVGQNVGFDFSMLKQLWSKCRATDTFPFGRRMMDTMMLAFMVDYAEQSMAEGYSLFNLLKKYGIKNNKAHTAASDTLATKELFLKQMSELRKKLGVHRETNENTLLGRP